MLSAINALIAAPETTAPDYNRDLFGGDWIDADGDGCDTRCEVLEAERVEIPVGQTGWVSLYDNYSTDDESELDIDHMVPLAEAWRSGASTWEPSQRIAYANDLDAPTSLIAVTAATNRSKSDKDPAQWQPPSDDAWCAYVDAWVTTKTRWALTADTAELAALRNMATARSC
ncbi:MAG: HNH endonuclease family protein [Iamia sp.]